jgi:transcriptional regulator
MTRPTLALVQGTLDVLILRALSAGPNHGYGVSNWIRQRTEGELVVEDGALYQALHRLERQGWLAAEWGVSDNNRRAKFYELTPKGKRHLRTEAAQWRRYAQAVFKVLEPA